MPTVGRAVDHEECPTEHDEHVLEQAERLGDRELHQRGEEGPAADVAHLGDLTLVHVVRPLVATGADDQLVTAERLLLEAAHVAELGLELPEGGGRDLRDDVQGPEQERDRGQGDDGESPVDEDHHDEDHQYLQDRADDLAHRRAVEQRHHLGVVDDIARQATRRVPEEEPHRQALHVVEQGGLHTVESVGGEPGEHPVGQQAEHEVERAGDQSGDRPLAELVGRAALGHHVHRPPRCPRDDRQADEGDEAQRDARQELGPAGAADHVAEQAADGAVAQLEVVGGHVLAHAPASSRSMPAVTPPPSCES